MANPGGFGFGGFGPGAFGLGGPILVLRALAVAGQVVRVVFDEEPLHRSPAGSSDALNASNYTFSVPGGNATAPTPVGIDTDLIVGPARGVGNGSGAGVADERGVDVHVDRQLVVGVQYVVTVRNVRAAAGGILGSPNSAQFEGVTLLQATQLPARNQDLIDYANPPATGHYVIDDSGDVAPDDPEAGLRKRVYRRMTTHQNAFRWLKGYGAAIDLKDIGDVSKLSAFQTSAAQQIKLEPDVAAASVSATIQASGLTIVTANVKSRRGNFLSVGAVVSPLGSVSAV